VSQFAEGILKEFGPVVLDFAFDFVIARVKTLDSGVMKVVSPVIAEMLAAAQTEVAEYGTAGLVDEYGRLLPDFRYPFEYRLLQALSAAGIAESA
jgi:hypothetical protein